MMVNKRGLFLLITVIMSVFISCYLAIGVQEKLIFPGETWLKYVNPEEAGFSLEKLAKAKEFSEKIGSAAVLVIYDGVVLTSWGDVDRRYMCHSIRKSFMSALYGIYVDKGKINLDKNLADLGITENGRLTEKEKKARISFLLKARSGVYIPAAYETTRMKLRRPKKGSFAPGTYWYYNNWDFNVLGTIFEQETGEKIFEGFKDKIADPLQMEDYRIIDGYYHYEKENSIYPAYPFKMSARDMARFGLLYLRKGKWGNQQIIPKHWIDESTRSYSKTYNSLWDGYGYLWWINSSNGIYAARGNGENTIEIVPTEKIVFVHRANTYEGKNNSPTQVSLLLSSILDAKIGPSKPNPKLVPLSPASEKKKGIEISEDILNRYIGQYKLPEEIIIEIIKDAKQLIFKHPQVGNFSLIPYEPTKFFIEDLGGDLEFKDKEIVIHGNNTELIAKKTR